MMSASPKASTLEKGWRKWTAKWSSIFPSTKRALASESGASFGRIWRFLHAARAREARQQPAVTGAHVTSFIRFSHMRHERDSPLIRPHCAAGSSPRACERTSFLRERAGVAPKPEVPRGVARIPLLRLAVNERHAVRVHLDITPARRAQQLEAAPARSVRERRASRCAEPVDPAHAQAVLPVDEELVARAEARRALGHVTLWVRALIHRLHLGGAALERRRVAVCSILAAARLACQEEVVAGAGEQPLAPDDDAFQELVLGEVGRLRQQLRAVGEPDDGRIVARLVLLRLA
eukprot:5676993-Prymnesium_polylepis.1